ncbi:MAG: DNA repair protein RadA [Actinomycetota bacterium]
MARSRSTALCSRCGQRSARWVGRCSACGAWGTMEEVTLAPVPEAQPAAAPAPLSGFQLAADACEPTGIGELDRVLGGGLVRGGAYLLAGEPGVGKSTLLFQVAARAAGAGRRVLLICGEETPEQVRIRAERLGGPPSELWATRATDAAGVVAAMEASSAALVIVDSIQSLSRADVPGVPGSVGQVRACADALIRAAKDRGTTLVLVGQATKDGQVAGPRTLEHLVDAVLWFEGEPHGSLRLLRATKNRFGAAHEVGCFAMSPDGLTEITDPSSALVGRRDRHTPGVAVAPLLEGNRAMLVEIQALVGPTSVPAPRRTGAGLDAQRLGLLVAVLERRGRLRLGGHDVFAAAMGGVRAAEPAVDLAVALAVASSFLDAPLPAATIAIGEIGLSGEIRAVRDVARRLEEAARLGFRRAIVHDVDDLPRTAIELLIARDVLDALEYLERPTRNGAHRTSDHPVAMPETALR